MLYIFDIFASLRSRLTQQNAGEWNPGIVAASVALIAPDSYYSGVLLMHG